MDLFIKVFSRILVVLVCLLFIPTCMMWWEEEFKEYYPHLEGTEDFDFIRSYEVALKRAKEWRENACLDRVEIYMDGTKFTESLFIFDGYTRRNSTQYSLDTNEVWIGEKDQEVVHERIDEFLSPPVSDCIKNLDINKLSPQITLDKIRKDVIPKYPNRKFILRWGWARRDIRAKHPYVWELRLANKYGSIDDKEGFKIEFDSSRKIQKF